MNEGRGTMETDCRGQKCTVQSMVSSVGVKPSVGMISTDTFVLQENKNK